MHKIKLFLVGIIFIAAGCYTTAQVQTITGFSENFNNPIDLSRYNSYPFLDGGGPVNYTLTQENEMLKIEMDQEPSNKSLWWDFSEYYIDLSNNPMAKLKIKVENLSCTEENCDYFVILIATYAPSDEGLTWTGSEFKFVDLDTNGNSEWIEYTYDFSAGSGWDPENIKYTQYIFFTPINFIAPCFGTIYIDDFRLGDSVKLSDEHELISSAYGLIDSLHNFIYALSDTLSVTEFIDGLVVSANAAIEMLDSVNGNVIENPGSTTLKDKQAFIITAENGEYSTFQILIENSSFPILFFKKDITCYGSGDGSIELGIYYGHEPYSFHWSNSETTKDISGLSAGVYIIEVTDNNDSTIVDSLWISEPELLVVDIIDSSDISYHGFADGMALVRATGGIPPYSYFWDDPLLTTDTLVTCLPGKAIYHVEVKDMHSCSSFDSLFIKGSDRLFVEINPDKKTICFNDTAGSARAMAHFADYPVTYEWDDPGSCNDSLLTGIEPGVYYRIHVTDAEGRVGRDSVILAQTDSITLDSLFIEDVTGCYGDKNGWIGIMANLPYWSSVQHSIDSGKTYVDWGSFDDLAGGYHQVLIKDTNGCILAVDSIFVNQPPAINPTIDVIKEISCSGMCDASLSVSEEGGVSPFTYFWSSEQTSKELNGLCPEIYSLKVTDGDGCIDSASVVVNDPPPLTIESQYPEEICDGSLATVDLEVAGGISPYQIKINPGDSIIPVTLDLPAGEYIIAVTDSNGCEKADTVRINNIMPYPDPEICVVTVDTATGKNLIVWDKVTGQHIAYYNIYRETSTAGVFDTIATFPFDDANAYMDTTIDPNVQAAIYKISVVDSCGNESELSASHKTFHLLLSTTLQGGTNLEWEGYNVEGNNDFISIHEIYKTHCHPPYPLDMSLLAEVSYLSNSYTDNDPTASKRLYQYRIAGVLANSCPVSDSTGVLLTYDRAYSQATLDHVSDGCDEIPPSVPHNLNVHAEGSFLVLQWDRSDDLWGIEIYNIFDDQGEYMGNTPDSFYIFTDYPLDLANTFYVTAVDWNYNESEKSAPVIYIPVGWPDYLCDELNIFPNPARDELTITLPDQSNMSCQCILFDTYGRILKQEIILKTGQFTMDCSDLPPGLYFIELRGLEIAPDFREVQRSAQRKR